MKGGENMAKNAGEHRDGAVKCRSQIYNPHIDRFIKRDTATGQFMDQKADGEKFKGVRKEKE
jgi:hypothetical protein